jgi:hypothetical protein
METIRVVELRLTQRSVRTHDPQLPRPPALPSITLWEKVTVKWDRDGHPHTHPSYSRTLAYTRHTYLVTMITDPFRDGNGGEG